MVVLGRFEVDLGWFYMVVLLQLAHANNKQTVDFPPAGGVYFFNDPVVCVFVSEWQLLSN